MKRKYVTPSMTKYELEAENSFLKGSIDVETKTIEFKGHTDNYETESFDWDNITFE